MDMRRYHKWGDIFRVLHTAKHIVDTEKECKKSGLVWNKKDHKLYTKLCYELLTMPSLQCKKKKIT